MTDPMLPRERCEFSAIVDRFVKPRRTLFTGDAKGGELATLEATAGACQSSGAAP